MAIRYCGPGGSNANSGLTYALRKLDLNGVEDSPVAASDICYVAPGVYRELLTCDVSGTAGNPITYIADTSGANTDGIGGPVRVTGSDNDQTTTRASCITATSRNYRTFRGFSFDTCTGNMVTLLTASGNWILEDCAFWFAGSSALSFSGTGIGHTIRRCLFVGGVAATILFTHSAAVDNAGNVVENCILFPNNTINGIQSARVGGITVRHCWIHGGSGSIRVGTALTAGQFMLAYNNILTGGGNPLQATVTTEFTENYNDLHNTGARATVNVGANSVTYPPLFLSPMLLAGFGFPPPSLGELSVYSQIRGLAGTSMSSDDIAGITRPVTDAKKSWGPTQYRDLSRETTTKRTGAASLKLADAGVHQMWIPTSNVSTTFSAYVQWEANYAGTKPSMTIKQPGQSDTTVTATGSSGSWELLTTTLTPAASPSYCVVELRSSNTASGASIAVFWDDVAAT